jgi:hypothetical protein
MTPFTNEVLKNVGVREAYSFRDLFSRYHQFHITKEDRDKNTFAKEWGSFANMVIPFRLNNSLEFIFPDSGGNLQGIHLQVPQSLLG